VITRSLDYITTPTDPPTYERRIRSNKTYAHVDCFIAQIKKYAKRGKIEGYAQYLL
jgi:hypothetical protein